MPCVGYQIQKNGMGCAIADCLVFARKLGRSSAKREGAFAPGGKKEKSS
ncbi:hypothetical protein [Halobacillus litoralis]|nr:hypothetical protein [Halobacillus litoralis]MCA1023702.1 hypothetical protein [Halobacillus litoralis]